MTVHIESLPTSARVPAASGLLFRLAVLSVAALGIAWSTMMGWDIVVVQHALPSPDSYTRVLRLLASLHAGHIVDHVPGDNSGAIVPLHWTHLLEGVILLLSLPLMPFMTVPEALRLAGAAIGPLTTATAGIAAMYAVRVLTGRTEGATVAGVLVVLSTSVFCYAAFGRADHHVLMGTLAIMMLALAYASAARGPRVAGLAGLVAAFDVWTSAEAMPFALLGWAVAIVVDATRDGRIGQRATAYSGVYCAVLAAALALDPPPAGFLRVEIDRLSRPFVEQAALMIAATLIGARLVPTARAWPASLWGAVVAAAAVVPWVALHPSLLAGARSIYTEEAWRRIWADNAEIKSSFSSLGYFSFFFALPLVILTVSMVVLALKRRDPMAVLAIAGIAFLLLIGAEHVRMAIYAQLAAAVCTGILMARGMDALPALRRRLIMALVALPLVLLPMIGLAAFGDPSIAEKTCVPRAAAHDLAPFAGKIVLMPFMDGPELMWFAGVHTVAGPYHRAQGHILDGLDAYESRDFRDGMPAAFRKTGAGAVLICPAQPQEPGSLGEALARGQPPAWLIEKPVSADSGYRLYVVR